MDKARLVVVAGPTASGKTAAAVRLAKEIGGEIVSADSMQVYRYLDIGSAKVKPEETGGIPHHLISVLDPKEPFNVTVFKALADEAIEGIYARGRIPVLCGGTGFYIQAVLRDIDFDENAEGTAYREALQRLADEKGAGYLHEMLLKKDPKSAEAIHENNVKRMIRALEFLEKTGFPISEHNAREREKKSPYDFDYFVLTRERKALYEGIERRVDRMMEEGLLEEVRFLKDYGCTPEMTSMQGLGYKQLLAYLNGYGTLEEAVSRIKTETRHFAKRQLTWFRREADAVFVDTDREDLLDVYFRRRQA